MMSGIVSGEPHHFPLRHASAGKYRPRGDHMQHGFWARAVRHRLGADLRG
jgi:hypothetical protein